MQGGCIVLPESWGLWGSRGIDAWYMGLFLDHYQCCHYVVPEMQTYRISGSTEVFPQHCQVPCLTYTKHLQGLTDKMIATLSAMMPGKQQCVLTLVQSKLAAHDLARSTLVHMHPLHEGIFLAGNPQCSPHPKTMTPPEQTVNNLLVEQWMPVVHPL
jgi:hypothetical protein